MCGAFFVPGDADLNPIDWSSGNQLSVCLGGEVYLWNAATGTVDQLLQLPSPSAYVCSVSWSADGVYLALGTSEHQVRPLPDLPNPTLSGLSTLKFDCVNYTRAHCSCI